VFARFLSAAEIRVQRYSDTGNALLIGRKFGIKNKTMESEQKEVAIACRK
jgi:hypothetical protein